MSYRPEKVVYSCHDQNFMEVVDHDDTRSLYFRNAVVQSRISLQNPHKLILRYSRYMMAAALLVKPTPTKILLIGIGAGSFVHFLNHYFPHSYIDGVDYSENVITIARNYFSLPENRRITIHCDDGLHFLSQRQESDGYDLILIDAFNDHGMARNIYSSEFLRLAQKNLLGEGVICCNLWSGNRKLFKHVQKAIRKNSEKSLFVPVRKRENIIGLLFQSPLPWKKICPPAADLDQLSKKFGFDFSEVSISARKNNMKIGEKFQLLFS
jgi:spermidine synthase